MAADSATNVDPYWTDWVFSVLSSILQRLEETSWNGSFTGLRCLWIHLQLASLQYLMQPGVPSALFNQLLVLTWRFCYPSRPVSSSIKRVFVYIDLIKRCTCWANRGSKFFCVLFDSRGLAPIISNWLRGKTYPCACEITLFPYTIYGEARV